MRCVALGRATRPRARPSPGSPPRGKALAARPRRLALEHQQRAERVERGEHLRGGVAGGPDQARQARARRGRAGAGTARRGRSRTGSGRPLREGRPRPAPGAGRPRPLRAAPGVPGPRRAGWPTPSGRHRGALGGEPLGDLGNREVLGSQDEHPVADGLGLAGSFGAGLGGAEEARSARPQLGGELVHGGRRVAEAGPDVLGAGSLDEVGPQRLVAALGRLARLHEVLSAGPHTSGDLSERHIIIVES